MRSIIVEYGKKTVNDRIYTRSSFKLYPETIFIIPNPPESKTIDLASIGAEAKLQYNEYGVLAKDIKILDNVAGDFIRSMIDAGMGLTLVGIGSVNPERLVYNFELTALFMSMEGSPIITDDTARIPAFE